MFSDKRLWLWVLAALLAGGAGFWLAPRPAAEYIARPETGDGLLRYPVPKQVPEFSLIAGAGAFTRADLLGRQTLVFIGFTHCPDICPTSLNELGRLLARWRSERDDPPPQVLFISVDPERDDTARLAEYARYFDPEIRAATAPHAVLEPLTRALGMLYVRVPHPDDPARYTVDHSGSILVIDDQARLIGLFRNPHRAEDLYAGLVALQGVKSP